MLEVPASVTQVLEQIDAKMPYLTAAPGFADNMLPAAALKRARRLVDALVAVHKAGVGDTGGLVARAIWECWIVGLYLVLDGDKAHEHLLGAWRRRQRKLSENWPGGPPPDSVRIEDFIEAAEADLNFADIAKAVHKLMNQDGRESTMIGSTYDSLYRSYSGYDAHITLGVLYRYLDDKDGVRLELKRGRVASAAGGRDSAFGHLRRPARLLRVQCGQHRDRQPPRVVAGSHRRAVAPTVALRARLRSSRSEAPVQSSRRRAITCVCDASRR